MASQLRPCPRTANFAYPLSSSTAQPKEHCNGSLPLKISSSSAWYVSVSWQACTYHPVQMDNLFPRSKAEHIKTETYTTFSTTMCPEQDMPLSGRLAAMHSLFLQPYSKCVVCTFLRLVSSLILVVQQQRLHCPGGSDVK
jgi:hypothetical protein